MTYSFVSSGIHAIGASDTLEVRGGRISGKNNGGNSELEHGDLRRQGAQETRHSRSVPSMVIVEGVFIAFEDVKKTLEQKSKPSQVCRDESAARAVLIGGIEC